MEIGIIGINSLTIDLANRATKAGFKVIINNPKGSSLVRDCIEKMGTDIHLGSLNEAAAPDLVVIFLPKENLEDTIRKMPDMSGKTVLHTSGLISDPQSLLSGISNAMAYKTAAALFPAANVVKLFSPMPCSSHLDTTEKQKKEELFFIADCSDSRNKANTFLKKMQFLPVDLSSRLKLQNNWIDTVWHQTG
ncbi:NAD(P)-binding domain-containing protein [Flavobacterium sp. TR2]|uniref:NAD(P)-binding domain-containing protein n=1 Tax=Flavobacterium sp. TR2 TaxID=2977321 RepID=UPI0021B0F940|nr:NAD(P)-binding domain-containing protein [Flavobacterium sp. TR2]UWY27428.1 NAD(P)-binding domain-containing protein [Flavobacterium sp. TR2]